MLEAWNPEWKQMHRGDDVSVYYEKQKGLSVGVCGDECEKARRSVLSNLLD